jgi:TonB family protein
VRAQPAPAGASESTLAAESNEPSGSAAHAPDPAPGPARVEVIPPRPSSDTSVDYPAQASGDASVELELVITASGEVSSASVLSGAEPFARAARLAALGWSFEPARRAGRAMPARIRFLVGFEQQHAEPEPIAGSMPGAPPAGVAPPVVPPPEPLQVTVTGDRPAGAPRVISRAFARELPGAFGNPFAALEASPGVTPTLSGAPYFYVRGAPPGNLGYFLDDIRLPLLFHVLAGPSVVHPAMVEGLDFYPGPYPARYGRYTGGIAAGKLRRASYELHGELSLRAFDSSGLVEVPLSRDGDAPMSLTLSGRVAYANPIAHLFAPEISVAYWDYQARFSHEPSPRDEISVLAFGSRDRLDRQLDSGQREIVFGAEFHRLQLRYERRLERGSLRLAGVGGWDRSDQADGNVQLENTTGRVRADLTHSLGSRVRIEAGADIGLDRYGLDVTQLDDDDDEREDFLERYPSRTDSSGGIYLGSRLEPGAGVRVDAGCRLDLFGSKGALEAAVSPSVFAEFDIGSGLTLIHGFGLAHQPPSSGVPQPGSNPVLGAGLQHALQSSAGVRVALPLDLALNVTLYQAALFDLTDGIGISRIDNADDEIEESSRATGSSRGLELLVQRAFGHAVAGYVAYTLGSSRRSVGRAEGPALFDRRHVLSGALSYRWGSGFRAGVRGTFYTGIPADVAYLAAAEDPPRTAPFYRIDLRLEKRWPLGSNAFLAVVLEVLNTTLHREALGKSCSAYVCREDRVGPLTIPSLGLEALF